MNKNRNNLIRTGKDSQQNEKWKKRISLEIDFYESLLKCNDEQVRQLLPVLDEFHHDIPVLRVMHTFFERDNEQFWKALVQHMKDFWNISYPGELNYFALVMEVLYLKRNRYDPLDFADAPALLLKLPECNPALVGEKIGLSLQCH